MFLLHTVFQNKHADSYLHLMSSQFCEHSLCRYILTMTFRSFWAYICPKAAVILALLSFLLLYNSIRCVLLNWSTNYVKDATWLTQQCLTLLSLSSRPCRCRWQQVDDVRSCCVSLSFSVLLSVTDTTNYCAVTDSRCRYKTLVQACIASRLDYCNAVPHGITNNLLQRLQSVQNAAARLVTRTGRCEHITPVLRELHWLPVRRRVEFMSPHWCSRRW